MSSVTTHVLDTTKGKPAEGVAVVLEYRADVAQEWTMVGRGTTDHNGRLQNLSPVPGPGLCRLRFDTSRLSPFFPEISIQFIISEPGQHYHIPLLLSSFSYTTYRGS